jgi:cobalt-precorrin-5B (C1)-methyltransferase
MNDQIIVLTTGGRSEDFSKDILDLPDHCYIQMGDFAAYAIRQASIRGMKKVIIAGFIGKLSKIAMGIKQTHVKGSKVDMNFLAELARGIADDEVIEEIKNANTARHISEIIMKHGIKGYFDRICYQVCKKMSKYASEEIEVGAIMFDFDGKVIGSYALNNIIKYKSV